MTVPTNFLPHPSDQRPERSKSVVQTLYRCSVTVQRRRQSENLLVCRTNQLPGVGVSKITVLWAKSKLCFLSLPTPVPRFIYT